MGPTLEVSSGSDGVLVGVTGGVKDLAVTVAVRDTVEGEGMEEPAGIGLPGESGIGVGVGGAAFVATAGIGAAVGRVATGVAVETGIGDGVIVTKKTPGVAGSIANELCEGWQALIKTLTLKRSVSRSLGISILGTPTTAFPSNRSSL